jgi:hypothetical protein
VTAHALADATDFNRVREYDQRQAYTGTSYRFRFGKEAFQVKCRDQARIATLDAVLDRARTLKEDPTARDEVLASLRLLPPSSPAAAKEGWGRPFSPPWQAVMAIYALVFFVLFFGGIIYGRSTR